MIPIYRPSLTGREREYVNECLDSSWISSRGKFVEQFEQGDEIIQRLAAGYPANYRHTLGMRLAMSAIDLLTELLKTNASSDYAMRSSALLELRTKLFILCMELRLGKDLELIPKRQHAAIHEHLVGIRKQISGWLKWTERQRKPA